MRNVLPFLGLAALAGCDLPLDPEGTTERVRGREMRVGVCHDPPWGIVRNGEPSGVDVELVRRFADEMDAEIRWSSGTESELLTRLHLLELDLVIGGLRQPNPWSSKVGLSIHYHREHGPGDLREFVWAVPPGENGWLVTIDDFLYRHRGEVPTLLDREGAK